jgi:polyhydroxyalkanoate synthesis repressor PhaR
MKTGKVVIKKYANRRLYDTSASRYINLEDIAALIRNGTEVQVLDATSGEDLTRVTLTQVITEDAKEGPSGLPLELLRQLIVTTDRVGQEFILWYLKSAYDTYQSVQSSVQNRLSEMQSAAMSPLEMVKNLVKGPAPEAKQPDTELERLQRRIAELEAKAVAPKKKRAAKSKRAKR